LGIADCRLDEFAATQYRNPDPTFAKKLSNSSAYKSKPSQARRQSRQSTVDLRGDPGQWIIETWKEQAAGVTLASVNTGATPLLNAQTG